MPRDDPWESLVSSMFDADDDDGGIELQPVIDLDPGVYGFPKFQSVEQYTADDSFNYLAGVYGITDSGKPEFDYGNHPVSEYLTDGFVKALYDVIPVEPSKFIEQLEDGTVPVSTLRAMDHNTEPYTAEWMDTLHEDPSFIKPVGDVEGAMQIASEMEDSGKYWPVAYWPGESLLDGAHRAAALLMLLGEDAEAYSWRLSNGAELR